MAFQARHACPESGVEKRHWEFPLSQRFSRILNPSPNDEERYGTSQSQKACSPGPQLGGNTGGARAILPRAGRRRARRPRRRGLVARRPSGSQLERGDSAQGESGRRRFARREAAGRGFFQRAPAQGRFTEHGHDRICLGWRGLDRSAGERRGIFPLRPLECEF